MTDNRFDLSRRKVLGSLGVVGTGAVLGGAGTAALFNDDAELTDNRIQAGKLELLVEGEFEHDKGDFTRDGDSGELTFDGDSIGVEFGDTKPGDSGYIQLCLEVDSNPAWVWISGTERKDDGIGDYLNAELVFYDKEHDEELKTILGERSFSSLLDELENGVALNPPTDEDYFGPNHKHCILLKWNLPLETENDVQEDILKWDLEFYAEQRRHNPDPNDPFA